MLVRHEDGTLATYAHLRYASVVVASGEAVVAWIPRVLRPEELPWAWLGLALWVAAGIAGMAWFWRFSNS